MAGTVLRRDTPRVVVLPKAMTEHCLGCDVRAQSVCRAIDDANLHRLAELASVAEIEAGQTFINEGDTADRFFNLTSGTVKLYKMLPDGRQQITGFAGPGHFLGLAVSDTYAFSAEAIEKVTICRFSRPRLQTLLHDFPAIERCLLDVAANELVLAQEQMLLLGRKTAIERLASFLLARSRMAGVSRTIHLPMTRQDIADYLGLTLETVSRGFTRLRNEKVIAIAQPQAIEIRDAQLLAAIASGAN
jgi:CRP/FNR family transcriptional regulator